MLRSRGAQRVGHDSATEQQQQQQHQRDPAGSPGVQAFARWPLEMEFKACSQTLAVIPGDQKAEPGLCLFVLLLRAGRALRGELLRALKWTRAHILCHPDRPAIDYSGALVSITCNLLLCQTV